MRLVTVTSIAALVVSIAVLVFVLGLYAELEKSESETATSDVPLLDEGTVEWVTFTYLWGNFPNMAYSDGNCQELFSQQQSAKIERRTGKSAEYVGKDIWVVRIGGCTHLFHDKKGHVIQP
jgi:hypothetical protein